jgi:Cu2+-exporting ATPase
MDRYFAQELPADKADYVETLQREGRKVCFVGDGINDAIALKKANVSISLRGATSIATDTAHVVFMEQSLGKLCELRDIARDLDRNVRNSWLMILGPNLACIGGVFTLGFGIGASVVTNNIAALAALANGLLPMRRVAQLEAERRHVLEMELRQSGLLREDGAQIRSAGYGAELARTRAPAASAVGNAEARRPHESALAAD